MDFIDCPSIVTGVLCFGGDIDGGIIDVGILGGTQDQPGFPEKHVLVCQSAVKNSSNPRIDSGFNSISDI